ncbi:LysM peptidoglycan-binding domain-containing protein [Candidatus Pelagibacter sp.]|uniref:LysM peptidoglycan-binding domain-containing protein n=1 Tax=Candidatus Pelagibacter sp. TaxID=2024849 RepID=UPI003F84B4AB
MLLNSVAKSDPFTNEIGIIKEPEIVEVQPEETQEPEDIIAEDIVEEVTEDLFTEEPEQEVVVVETQPKEKEIITVLNIDPMLAYSLKDYTLKGTALSKESSNKFQRTKIKKFDRAKIPTTHTILENETIEKIAFRYGFSLREIELANAIYPGSRKLVTGDKLVIPHRIHIVKEGQSLNDIADRYKIDPIQLASYNDKVEDDILLIGEKLHLPFFIHVTDENETLSDIAGRYEREIDELVNFNNFDDSILVINENQLIKIPIYANRNIDYENLDKKSVNDFKIDKKNLAIVEINNGQYMVREGDRIGNKDGVIVSIQKNMMIVLEDNIEFEFLINTPIVGQAIASLPTNEIETNDIIQTNDTQINDDATVNTNEQASTDGETITNVEDLFN